MNAECPRFRQSASRGYLIVLLVVIVAFVGVVASMQVLILTSVATTSRAYDGYRQGATELVRIERAVTETLFDQCQISVARPTGTPADALRTHLDEIGNGGATISATLVPAVLPTPQVFPPATGLVPDALSDSPSTLPSFFTPELALLAGPRIAAYPEVAFEFSSVRTVLESTRSYRLEVRARLIGVPLTRFSVSAYELPADLGAVTGAAASGPTPNAPAGLVPARDAAFVRDFQAQPGVLPYHYRRRAALATAYQYVFSQVFIDRIAEYAGVTHFCNLGVPSGTAVLAGMTRNGPSASWDLGLAGSGTFDTITEQSDAAVVFSESAGQTLRLYDSIGHPGGSALMLVILGPSHAALGPLQVELGSITRPIVIIGYNIRLTAPGAVNVNGALFLDPASRVAVTSPIVVGHLSYWAGSSSIPANAIIATGSVPGTAEAIAPRVVYVATKSARL